MADDKKPPVIIQNPRRRLEGEGAHADRRLADRELQRLRTTFIEMGGLAEARRRVVRSDGTLIEAISRNNHDGHGHGPLEEVRVVRNPIPSTPGKCKFTLESGLLDCLDTGLNSPPAKAADTLYPVPNVDNATYPVGFSAKDNGALTVDMWFGLVQPKTSKALPGDAASGFHIAKQKGMSNLPASVFTGKTKLWVQALYGLPATVSVERYRFLDFGDESVLIFRWYKGKTLVERTIGWDFAHTDVVYTAPDYSYWLVSFLGSSNLASARVEYCAMQLSACGELLRKWLVANIQAVQNNLLAGLSLERVEAFLLSQVVALGDPVTVAGSEPVMVAAALKGGPVGYGWKAKRDGTRVSVVHFRQVNTPGGLPGYFQTDLSHIDIAYNGALPVNQRFSITPSLGNAPKNFTLSGYQQIWRPVGNTLVAYRVNFAAPVYVTGATVYGFYDAGDTWREVKLDIGQTRTGYRIVSGWGGGARALNYYGSGQPYNYYWCGQGIQGAGSQVVEYYDGGATVSGFYTSEIDLRGTTGYIRREKESIVVMGNECVAPFGDEVFYCPESGGQYSDTACYGSPNKRHNCKVFNVYYVKVSNTTTNAVGYSSVVVPKGDSAAVYLMSLQGGTWANNNSFTGTERKVPDQCWSFSRRYKTCSTGCPGSQEITICVHCNTEDVDCPQYDCGPPLVKTVTERCVSADDCRGDRSPITGRSILNTDSRGWGYPIIGLPYTITPSPALPSNLLRAYFYNGDYTEQIADTYTAAWDGLFVVSISSPTYSNPFFTTSSYVSGDVFHWGNVAVNEYKMHGDYTVTPTVGWRFVGWA